MIRLVNTVFSSLSQLPNSHRGLPSGVVSCLLPLLVHLKLTLPQFALKSVSEHLPLSLSDSFFTLALQKHKQDHIERK